MIFTETPFMSEPNPELGAQFAKEDAERKAQNELRKSGGGKGGGGVGNVTGGGKTWGSSSSQQGSGSAGGDLRKRGTSKEKR